MIRKRTINLVIRQEQLPTPYARLNRILPRVAAGVLVLFLLVYGAVFIYLQINIGQFERTKQDIVRLEQSIAQKKTAEGLYTIAHEDIAVIERLTKEKKNYPRLLTDLFTLQTPHVSFSSVTIAEDNHISVSVTAATSAALQEFADTLLKGDKQNRSYTQILAQGILRDRSGSYSLTLSMVPNPSLLQ